ncbi:MAG: GNAT family N-acetyltransferase, partial [Candidatus Omnitrophica bacterium]|nr:GNAT family N-acetyltransferase [Candidatus Omnitrophota bacterium]
LVGAILFVTQPLLTLGILTVAGISLRGAAIVVPGSLLVVSLLQGKNFKGLPEQSISPIAPLVKADGGILKKRLERVEVRYSKDITSLATSEEVFEDGVYKLRLIIDACFKGIKKFEEPLKRHELVEYLTLERNKVTDQIIFCPVNNQPVNLMYAHALGIKAEESLVKQMGNDWVTYNIEMYLLVKESHPEMVITLEDFRLRMNWQKPYFLQKIQDVTEDYMPLNFRRIISRKGGTVELVIPGVDRDIYGWVSTNSTIYEEAGKLWITKKAWKDYQREAKANAIADGGEIIDLGTYEAARKINWNEWFLKYEAVFFLNIVTLFSPGDTKEISKTVEKLKELRKINPGKFNTALEENKDYIRAKILNNMRSIAKQITHTEEWLFGDVDALSYDKLDKLMEAAPEAFIEVIEEKTNNEVVENFKLATKGKELMHKVINSMGQRLLEQENKDVRDLLVTLLTEGMDKKEKVDDIREKIAVLSRADIEDNIFAYLLLIKTNVNKKLALKVAREIEGFLAERGIKGNINPDSLVAEYSKIIENGRRIKNIAINLEAVFGKDVLIIWDSLYDFLQGKRQFQISQIVESIKSGIGSLNKKGAVNVLVAPGDMLGEQGHKQIIEPFNRTYDSGIDLDSRMKKDFGVTEIKGDKVIIIRAEEKNVLNGVPAVVNIITDGEMPIGIIDAVVTGLYEQGEKSFIKGFTNLYENGADLVLGYKVLDINGVRVELKYDNEEKKEYPVIYITISMYDVAKMLETIAEKTSSLDGGKGSQDMGYLLSKNEVRAATLAGVGLVGLSFIFSAYGVEGCAIASGAAGFMLIAVVVIVWLAIKVNPQIKEVYLEAMQDAEEPAVTLTVPAKENISNTVLPTETEMRIEGKIIHHNFSPSQIGENKANGLIAKTISAIEKINNAAGVNSAYMSRLDILSGLCLSNGVLGVWYFIKYWNAYGMDPTKTCEQLLLGKQVYGYPHPRQVDIWLAWKDNAPLGYVVVLGADKYRHIAYVAVVPAMRRQGVGLNLMKKFFKYAKSQGVEE